MEKIIKSYNAPRWSALSAIVKVGEKMVDVRFRNNSTPGVGCKFTTSNPELQKAIEARSDYGTGILLHTVLKEVVEEVAPQTPVHQETIMVPLVAETPVQEAEQAKRVVDGISNFQAAKAWIAKNIEGITPDDLKNKGLVEKAMEDNRITFPDWT